MKKASDKPIESLDVDWGVGTAYTDGLPYSGTSVQTFIKGQLRSLQSQGNDQGTAIGALQNDMIQAKADIASNRGAILNHSTELDDLGTTIGNHAMSIAAHDRELSQLGTRMGALETKATNNATAITGINASITTLQTAIETNASDIESNTAAIAANAADISTLSAAKADKADYVVLSEDEYEALAVKDGSKFYFLYEE